MADEFAINLGNRRIASDAACYVVAEIGVNHNGDPELAHKMIDIALETGADAVKFQTYRTDDLVLNSAEKAGYQKDTTGQVDRAEHQCSASP